MWEAVHFKFWSSEEFKNVGDVKVSDDDGFTAS